LPSPAVARFREALERGRVLRGTGVIARSKDDRQVYYHASLAATVAAWEIYVHQIIRSFFAEIATPANYGFHALHTVAREEAERKLQRFHTPNWENSRELLVFCIGYDPIHDWIWLRQGLSAQQVREFMNEVLRVRHSFAHGHAMPTYSWNRSNSGRVGLTVAGLRRVESLFVHLARSTDEGVARLIKSSYGRTISWR
jgi:hypothetical protein